MFKGAVGLTQSQVEALKLKGKQVLITTNRGAKYLGRLVRIGEDKFTLANMSGLSKCGTYKFMEDHAYGARQFNYTSTIKMELAESYVEPKFEWLGRPTDRADACNIICEKPPYMESKLPIFQHFFQTESPEHFFEVNKRLEPGIWFDVLNVMHIPVKNPAGDLPELTCYTADRLSGENYSLCFEIKKGRWAGKLFYLLCLDQKFSFDKSMCPILRALAVRWVLMNSKQELWPWTNDD